MSATPATRDLAAQMQAWHDRLLGELAARGIVVDPYRSSIGPGKPFGVAAARAYPIQGVLKYHGLADWALRTAYLPSISVTNDAACTLTLVEFEESLDADLVVINGAVATGRPRDRVTASLDAVRRVAGIGSRARVSEVLTRKRPLTMAMIRNLCKGLRISAEVLIQPYRVMKNAA